MAVASLAKSDDILSDGFCLAHDRLICCCKDIHFQINGYVLHLFFCLLLQHKLHCTSASLFHQNLLSLDEVAFQAVLVMADGEQLQAVVVLDTETIFEVGSQLFQLLFVAVETEGEHQRGSLNHVGVDVELDAKGENGFQVVFVHEGEVAGRDGDQGLVVLDNIGRDALVVFPMTAVDE